MSDFKKFYERKMYELYNQGVCFKAQTSMGTHPMTTRQPATFHYYLSVLETLVPETGRSEILYEAVRSAYLDILSSKKLTESAQQNVDLARGMLLNAWQGKCLRSDSERAEGETGFFASEESKKVSDDFITDWNSRSYTHSELVEKYQNTHLGEGTVGDDGE